TEPQPLPLRTHFRARAAHSTERLTFSGHERRSAKEAARDATLRRWESSVTSKPRKLPSSSSVVLSDVSSAIGSTKGLLPSRFRRSEEHTSELQSREK